MLNSDSGVQERDASKINSSINARYKIFIIIYTNIFIKIVIPRLIKRIVYMHF